MQTKANRSTKDLDRREKELDMREKAIAAREAKLVNSRGAVGGTDISVSLHKCVPNCSAHICRRHSSKPISIISIVCTCAK